ncbi:MAG: hypothetical protein H7Y59_08270 [Anaerolineales bacterium]|nr:hypothetical protein [Anaerolineales bacterium]
MNQAEFVIFAELDRDVFDQILERLMHHFQNVQFGRQGDDWIWVNFSNGKIEIDTFYSTNLEVKGERRQYSIAMELLHVLENKWIIKEFDPPKVDLTR